MTAIELMVGLFLGGCATRPPVFETWQGTPYEVRVYDCPLVMRHGPMVVLSHRCLETGATHALAIWNEHTLQGYVLDQFGGVAPAYENINQLPIYHPLCP